MKALSGAIVLLSASILFAGGAIADSILVAVQRSGYSAWPGVVIVGALVGVVGFVLLGVAWNDPTPLRERT